jgi:O-antigen ligase
LKILKRFLVVLCLVAALTGVIAILAVITYKLFGVQWSNLLIGYEERFFIPGVSMFSDLRTDWGNRLLVVFPILLFASVVKGNGLMKQRWARVLLALCTIGLLLSFSRSSWIGAGVSVVCMLLILVLRHLSLLAFKKSHNRRRLAIGTILVVILVAFIISPWMKSLAKLFLLLNPESVEIRMSLWRQAMDYISLNPIAGMGFGSFRIVAGNNVHNLILEVFLAVGLIGTIPFLLFIVHTLLRGIYRLVLTPAPSPVGIMVPLVAAVVGLIAADSFFGSVSSRSIWLSLALLSAASNILRNGKDESGARQLPPPGC